MRRRDFCLAPLPLIGIPALGATLPRPSPDISITMPGEPPLALSKYKGNVIALEFLLTTCSHCQKASVAMEKVFKELRAKGFQALGVAINDGADVRAYAQQFGLSYPVGSIRNDKSMEYLQIPMMGRMMMPQLVFIDRKFAIRSQYSGEAQFFAVDEEKNMRTEAMKLLSGVAGKVAPKKTSK